MKKFVSGIMVLIIALSLFACKKDIKANEDSNLLSSSETISQSSIEQNSSEVSIGEASKPQNVSSNVSSGSVQTSSKVPQKNESEKNKQTNSKETVDILNMETAIEYKNKIICPQVIFNKDYTVSTFYENTWDEKFYLCVYDNKVFFHDTVTTPKGGSYFSVFTCDENGKNVKEIVKETIGGMYTIYRGRVYYYSEELVGNTTYETYISSVYIDGTDERKEFKLTGFTQMGHTVVKDSIMYSWCFENNVPCIIKFDPINMSYNVIKRYPNPPSHFWRDPLHIAKGELYYYKLKNVYRVNLEGEDIKLFDTKGRISFTDSGIIIGEFGDSDVSVKLYPFTDIESPVDAPKGMYQVVRLKTQLPFKQYVYTKKDKIIYFLNNE